jgi:hypothetical protein
MDYLLPALAFMTFAAAILFARWSKARTEKALQSRGGHSSLARDVPDPNFLPDADVTDPKHLTH